MSRSGYSADCENLALYRGAVLRAIRGKRGQHFLRRLIDALDAMPDKALAAGVFVDGGCECTIAVVALADGVALDVLHAFDDDDEVDPAYAGQLVDVAPSMAAEVMFENDSEWGAKETPAERWVRMHKWADEHAL